MQEPKECFALRLKDAAYNNSEMKCAQFMTVSCNSKRNWKYILEQ